MPSIAPLDHARSGRRRRLARLPAHELGHRCPGEFRDTARGLLSATDRDPVTSVAEFVTRIHEIGCVSLAGLPDGGSSEATPPA